MPSGDCLRRVINDWIYDGGGVNVRDMMALEKQHALILVYAGGNHWTPSALDAAILIELAENDPQPVRRAKRAFLRHHWLHAGQPDTPVPWAELHRRQQHSFC